MDTPLIDDDHIIALLRKDAQAGRLGSSFTAQRRDKNAPKPNTRFLRNLVRDADSHNAALLAKEKAETRARLKGLENGTKRSREDVGSRDDDDGSKRQRRGGEREGRWKGVLSGLGKPSLRERDGESRSERPHKSKDQTTRDPAKRRDTDERTHKESHAHRRRRSRSPDSPRHHKRSHRDLDRDRKSSYRSRSPEPKHRKRNRSRSRDRRSRSPDDRDARRSTTRSRPSAPHKHRSPSPKKSPHDSPSDSDSPLTSFLGPAPPPKILPRGRGAASSTRSTMDLRFNDPSYNPRADVALSDSGSEGASKEGARKERGGGDDWSTSLEAIRDRAAWREKGAQRLRDAGFKEQDVMKWESGGREKDERDLKWRGRGEGREWDAGKVAGEEEGEVRGKAAWTKGLGGL